MSRAFYNENCPKTAAWLRELIAAGLIAEGVVDQRSITEIQPHELDGYTQHHFFAGIGGWPLALRLAGWPDNEPVATGSCPCQPFSLAGDGRGAADERHLWPAFYRLICARRFPAVFGEQVGGESGREWLAGVRLDLNRAAYAVGAADLRADAFGAWHGRRRLFWCAADTLRVGGARLEPSRNPRPAGQGWPGRAQNLQQVYDRPFAPGSGWPKPLLRSVDDGLSSRMVGCSGAGDAIVPRVAQAFIESAMNTIRP